MLRKSTGTVLLLVAAGAVAACSSSNKAAGTDGGTDGRTGPEKDASKGKDSAADAVHSDRTPPPAAGPVARFIYDGTTVPNLLDVPFPSDLYLANGKVIDLPGASNVILGSTSFITAELTSMNGFSRDTYALFYVDDTTETGGIATIDPTTLPTNEAACVADTSSVFLIDLSATGTAARIPCRASFHDDRAVNAMKMTTGYRPDVSIGPGRGVVLQEGHQYATVMTSRVKTVSSAGGKNVAASEDFLALSSAPSSKPSPYAAALRTAQGILSSALASDKSSIVDMALFTTNTDSSVLIQMRNNLESVTVPTLAWDAASMAPMGASKFAAVPAGKTLPAGFTASLDDFLGKVTTPTLTSPTILKGADDPNADLPVRAHNKIAAIGTAVFQAQNYLSPSQHYAVQGGATFSYGSNGQVIPDPTNPTVPVWVTFFIPTAPMPANGYPVVIVQHGLEQSRAEEPFNLANTLASQGWIVAAIDSVTFGARAEEAMYEVDKVNNFASTCSAAADAGNPCGDGGVAAQGGTYNGPDGLADFPTNGLADFAGNLLNLGAIRDHLREDAIDTSQLARVLAAPTTDLSPLNTGSGVPKIDPTKIAYLGNSLGGIQGSMSAAFEPLIQNWVLNVAGGGFILELVGHSAYVGGGGYITFAGLEYGAKSDVLDESHPLLNFMQDVVDPGDPLTFANYVIHSPATVNGAKLTPRNILQIEVVYDKFVANEANEALARALGIGIAAPNVGSNSDISTLGMVQNPATIPDRLTFPTIMPDSNGLIHDTPQMGITAVLVQVSPGQHGANIQNGENAQQYAIPYDQFTTPTPFVALSDAGMSPVFSVKGSYLEQQAMAVGFLSDGFGGKGAPNVTGFATPVRDFDGDGYDDSVDSDVNNPNIH